MKTLVEELEKGIPIHGYKAFFNSKEADIYAETKYKAYEKAVKFFKPSKSKEHMVHVHLCVKNVDVDGNGEQVIHQPMF